MQERFFRFSIAGLIFLFFILFWYWLLGGKVTDIINIYDEKTVTLIIGLASLPPLGFITSSISKEIWEFVLFPKQPYLFLDPEPKYEQKYFQMIKRAFPICSGVKETNGKYEIENKLSVFINQQILLRKINLDKEALLWNARRMDVVYILIHCFISVLISFVISIALLYTFYHSSNIHFSFSLGKALWLIPVIGFLLIAKRQIHRALEESNNFEKRLLLKIYSKDPSTLL